MAPESDARARPAGRGPARAGSDDRRGGRRRRALGLLAGAGLAAGAGVAAWALWYRPDPTDGMGAAETLAAWGSLMVVTFLPHAGVGLALAGAGLGAARLWKSSAGAIVLSGALVGPWVLAGGGARPGAAAGDTLVVCSANLLGTSESDIELLEQIRAVGPDVVLLQEVQREHMERLSEALGEEYAAVAEPREHLFGEAVFSRLPISREARVVYPPGGLDTPQIVAWVEWEGRELCVVDVHLLAPVRAGYVRAQT